MSAELNSENIKQVVANWLNEVVIGLNLCPFASKPYKNQQIDIVVSDCINEACLLEQLQQELERLENTATDNLETTLLVVPKMLHDFFDYNQFLDYVDDLITQQGWTGTFQVANFHPDYQFAGTSPEDAENLTNRSPYPILHLLRENSLEKALQRYPNPEQIPDNNIKTVTLLSKVEKLKLFAFLTK